jgi:hypothetical protein
MQMHVWNGNNPKARGVYVCFLQGTANHNKPLASREGVVDVMAVLGAADDYYKFLDILQHVFYGFEVSYVKRLKSSHVQATVSHSNCSLHL